MKITIKELGNPIGYPHCYTLDSEEMFSDSERRFIKEDSIFIISCDSCPDAAYASVVSFNCGIHTQLMKFLSEFGPSVIYYGDKEFFIDVRDRRFQAVDKRFKTFREAFSYCFMEDKDFWDENRLNDGTKLAELH